MPFGRYCLLFLCGGFSRRSLFFLFHSNIPDFGVLINLFNWFLLSKECATGRKEDRHIYDFKAISALFMSG